MWSGYTQKEGEERERDMRERHEKDEERKREMRDVEKEMIPRMYSYSRSSKESKQKQLSN